MKGRFLTFEGGEGSGKSTQIKRVAEWLKITHQVDVIIAREPGGTPEAEAIRKLLIEGDANRWTACAEAFLHLAARNHHVINKIKPHLGQGQWVLCDRFMDSTLAYQGGGYGLDWQWLQGLNEVASAGLIPDLTFMLDIAPDQGFERALKRGENNRYETLDRGFHQRVYESFHKIQKDDPQRCRLIKADQSIENITSEITNSIAREFDGEL